MKRCLITPIFLILVFCLSYSKELLVSDISHTYYECTEDNMFDYDMTCKANCTINLNFSNNKLYVSLENLYLLDSFSNMVIYAICENNVIDVEIYNNGNCRITQRYFDLNFTLNDVTSGEYQIRIKTYSYGPGCSPEIRCDEMFNIYEGLEIDKEIGEPIGYEYTPLITEGAKFEYGRINMFDEPVFRDCLTYKIEGDTIVEGLNYKKLFYNNKFEGIVREENKKVYIGDKLLYDFNLNVGDTVPSNSEFNRVFSTYYQNIGGKYRKVILTNNGVHKTIDGLGNVYRGLFDEPYTVTEISYHPDDGHELYYQFACKYNNKNEVIYGNQYMLSKNYRNGAIVKNVSIEKLDDSINKSESESILIATFDGSKAECILKNISINNPYLKDLNMSDLIWTTNYNQINILRHTHTIYACLFFQKFNISFTLEGVKEGDYELNSITETDWHYGDILSKQTFKIKFIEGETTSTSEHNSIDSILTDYSGIGIDYTNDIVSISGIKSTATLAIYDLVGKKVAEESGEGEVSLSTETLPIGIYIVKATSDGKTSSRKIVVK